MKNGQGEISFLNEARDNNNFRMILKKTVKMAS